MFKKNIVGMLVLATFAIPAAAGTLGDIKFDGFVQIETWGTNHQGSTKQIRYDSFVQHSIIFSGNRELEDNMKFIWRLAERPRNGTFGDSGNLGFREAWGGVEGDFGAVKIGRFLSKAWELPDWPYGAPSYQSEPFAETGAANWVTTRALRYDSPTIRGLNLEFTYDVGQQNQDAHARSFEGYAHYSLGQLSLDGVFQRTWETENWVGVGVFGADDGLPTPVKGTWQGIYFLGARYTFDNGIEGIIGYKKNQWHNDAGVTTLSAPSRGLKATTSGTDVTSSDLLLGANYPFGKWSLNGGVQLWLGGKDNQLGSLNDKATTYSMKLQREVGRQTWLYGFVRYAKLRGNFQPIEVAGTWQINGIDAAFTKNALRIGVGGQMNF